MQHYQQLLQWGQGIGSRDLEQVNCCTVQWMSVAIIHLRMESQLFPHTEASSSGWAESRHCNIKICRYAEELWFVRWRPADLQISRSFVALKWHYTLFVRKNLNGTRMFTLWKLPFSAEHKLSSDKRGLASGINWTLRYRVLCLVLCQRLFNSNILDKNGGELQCKIWGEIGALYTNHTPTPS